MRQKIGTNKRTAPEKEKLICEDYLNGKTQIYLSKKYELSMSTIAKILNRKNIPKRSLSEAHRKYRLNENYFDKIDTEEKAYIFGFICADGHLHKNVKSIIITLNKRDSALLEKIVDCIYLEKRPLFYYKSLTNFGYSETVTLGIYNPTLYNSLRSYGLDNNKTQGLKFPYFLVENEDLFRHFLRGYFDGDGSIVWQDKFKKAQLSITSSYLFCESLRDILNKKYEINSYIYKRHKKSLSNDATLDICGNIKCLFILKKLYENCSISLERKLNKSKEVINNIKAAPSRKNKFPKYYELSLRGEKINDLIVEIEDLSQKSGLPEKVDQKFVDKTVLAAYGMA